MQNGEAAMENSMKIPQKIKNRTTILSSNPTSAYLSKRIEIRISKRLLALSHSLQYSQDVK